MDSGSVHFSVGSEATGSNLKHWVNQVCTHVSPLDITSDAASEFRGEFWRRQIGPLGLLAIRADPQSGARCADRHGDRELRYDVLYQRQGFLEVRQGSRSVVLAPGQLVLFNQAEHFEFTSQTPTDNLALACPASWLKTWLPDPDACLMTEMSEQSLWARSLKLMMDSLFESTAGAEGLEGHDGLIADQIGGCLALMCQNFERQATRYRSAFAREIIRSMNSLHARPSLSPADLAAHHRISKRYLHAIFASLGTTFGKELLGIRLRRAERLLRDDRYRRNSIGDIAELCGFEDPAHFARRFRQYRGLSPSVFRAGGQVN